MKVDYYINKLQAKGLKITSQRQEILRVFLESSNHHLSAEEVHGKITEKYPGMSLDTVYRNLSLLLNLGILTELNFGDRKSLFELNNTEHHHHLICTKCGSSQEINFCPLKFMDSQQVENFKIEKHSFEIFGICANCMK
ncbi:Fur family transcriptional regulator [Desulforamulus profundi]|uniref:Fur family transcriptional regulator n=1 Tax=Desulforamulus profundi TaxID=1383067 RepID=A0A2C6MIG3_9FIRM|nr:Fur family transcriptional regulator [Desulforamulus profundi]